MEQHFQTCIDACNECAAACDRCAAACLQEQDVQMLTRCIALDTDCAQMCRLAAGFMSRGSTNAPELCGACAEICDACAAECGQHQHEHCRQCAEACHRCAEECRRMSGIAQAEVRPAGGVAAHH